MIEEIFNEALTRKSVFKNRDALSPHYVPDNLPYREKQIQELSKTLAPILSGRKPENVFIYGKTGTGKTVVTKFVVRKLTEFAEQKGIPVGAVYINCRIHNTRSKVFIKIGSELLPEENFMGMSTAYIYEKILEKIREGDKRLIIVLDEIDKLKGLSDAVYSLNRANDELERGSISLIGISNNLTFKDRLDPRTKSTLLQHEMIFPPYNAESLRKILEDRAKIAFRDGVVEPGAIALVAAYAAKQSGDARYALQLLLRAGDVADEEGSPKVTEQHVERAKEIVEEDIILEMIATLPENEQILLLALAKMTHEGQGIHGFGSDPRITSGDLYTAYARLSETLGRDPVSERWFREYISDLSMYGIITVTQAGKGFKGNTRLIRLNFSPKKIIDVLEPRLTG